MVTKGHITKLPFYCGQIVVKTGNGKGSHPLEALLSLVRHLGVEPGTF
jgi:hypothetical protein